MEIIKSKIWWSSKAGALLCLLLLFAALPAVAGEIHPKLQAALQAADSGAEIPVIVRMAEQVDLAPLGHGPKKERLPKIVRALKEKADVSQRPLRDLLRSKGAKKEKSLWIINGVAATVTPATVEALAALSGVESVQLDEAVPAPVPLAVPAGPVEWNLTAVHAPELWNLGYTGQGVVVAGMDGGVDPNHPDLAGKRRGGPNSTNSWYDPNGVHQTPFDQDGHGTATMSVMVGGSAGGSAIGMAPDAQWIAVKIFPDAGPAPYSSIHAGFQWLLDPDDNPATADAPDVVNNSWGLANAGGCVTEFQTNVQALRAAGIAVVFAAGNSGPAANTSESPGNYPESFAVGAVDQSLTIAPFSSRGPSACGGDVLFPELAAPGVHIRVADLTFGGAFPDSYNNLSGTSFASPHVAGAMALLLSAFPALSVAELEAVLSSTATDRGTQGADNNYGQGLLNVFAAYRSLLDISVLPASHDFGLVNVGSAAPSQTFTITTNSSVGLAFDPAAITGSGSANFSITADGCSGTVLPPGGVCSMTALFHPFSEGTKNADLVVSYSDPTVRSLSIPLSGATFTKVTLLDPNGGELVPNGGYLPITWGAPLKAAKFNLAYSVDNGWTWWPIAAGVTGRSYNWPVPLQIANRPKTLVRVRGLNSSGIGVGLDRSDAPLAIEVVKLTSPNGGEILTSGTVKTITWATNATKRPVVSVRLWFTLNGGVTWQVVAPLLSGNPGSYNWTIPPVTTTRPNCRVKVVLRDAAGYPVGVDSSDNYFTTQPLP